MPNSDILSIKITKGSYEQLKDLNRELRDDDFSNLMVLNACLINDVTVEFNRIKLKNNKELAHEYLSNLIADNYVYLDRRGFFKKPRGMGKLA